MDRMGHAQIQTHPEVPTALLDAYQKNLDAFERILRNTRD